MKIALRAILVLFLIAVGGAIFIGYEARVFLVTPPQKHGEDIYFDVAPGAHLGQIADDLAQKGIITDSRKFRWLARLKKEDKNLQSGRFLLNTGWLPEQTLEALVNGMPALYRITIPEGLTWWQTARLLEEAGLARYEDMEAVIRDPDFLRHYGIPFATAEGFLMPDTYLLKKPDSEMPPPAFAPQSEEDRRRLADWRAQARAVAGRMVDNFWRKSGELWPEAPEKPDRETLKKWITLASIVEKETGVSSERRRVAGVYENRLARNMLLQADPTVIYGMGPTFRGRLRRAHLEDQANGYNTYYYAGLPPGPIASFGLAALKAAIRPEKHDYLFFVATGVDDTHTFTRNFEEHSRAVQEYRKARQK